MKYLGLEPKKLRIGVFDFTSCEGCELQLANKEETLTDFIGVLDIVSFREISSVSGDDYDIALVEGAITRKDEVERLKRIRENAEALVALGSCACFGGVAMQKNNMSTEELNRIVYGNQFCDSMPARPVTEVVSVDMEIPGCPVSKDEVESVVRHLVWGVPFQFPVYPVCVECRQAFTSCRMDRGELCLGSIARAGCSAPCPSGGLACWGCRGPAADPNYNEFLGMARKRGFSNQEIAERLDFFGGFKEAK